jgi:DNA polymerase I
MKQSNSNTKKLVVVDGSSYLFRAYHALPPLTTSTGFPSGAMVGVVNMLKKLMQEEKPDYFAVVFDTKSKNFRHALYPEYKANRPAMPEELALQIEPLHQIIQAMGIPLIAMEGYEADDVIGTLARIASDHGLSTVISTGDKDIAQLVDDKVTLVNTMTGSRLDAANVRAKFGVNPNQIVDYLTLIGDPVDNVPGIPKVGPKTAAKWLNEYQTLDNLIERAGEIKGKVGEYLRDNLTSLPLSKQLVTIQQDVPVARTPESLLCQPQNTEELKSLLEKYEFKSWLRELGRDAPSSSIVSPPVPEAKKGIYETVLTLERLQYWLDNLHTHRRFVLDTETTGLDPLQAELVGISLSAKVGEGAYIPLAHDYPDCPKQLNRDQVLAMLKPLLENPELKVMGQHIKYDKHILARYGITISNISDDTMLESYVLNSTATRHDMDSLANHYLHYKTIHFEDVAGKGAKQITFDKVLLEPATEYAAEDADVTLRLHEVLSSQLAQDPTLESVYKDIEVPLIDVLWQMEEYGVSVDGEKLAEQSQSIAIELKALEEQATILAGEEFNLASPKQLQVILFEKLKLPIIESTPTGQPSTAENVLQELSHDYELPKVILAHRTLSKLKSTYTDKLPLQINPVTHRVHTSYHQAVTATGRLSSTDPNLQNIPIRTPEGRKIRQAFVAPKGTVFLSADYSQIELRIMAHLSQDEGLQTAFHLGEDIHRFTASQILGIPLEQVTDVQRRSAKAINFGLIYGMSAFGLARQIDESQAVAKAYMEQYFHRYPKVKTYMDSIRKQAEQKGYVETLFGRRLYLPDIRSKNMARKRAAERAAINGPMQGTSADLIKKAMITIHQTLKNQKDIKMLMQVHDELVFEVKESEIERAKSIVVNCMQNVANLSVPLVVGVGIGKNWDEAH